MLIQLINSEKRFSICMFDWCALDGVGLLSFQSAFQLSNERDIEIKC